MMNHTLTMTADRQLKLLTSWFFNYCRTHGQHRGQQNKGTVLGDHYAPPTIINLHSYLLPPAAPLHRSAQL